MDMGLSGCSQPLGKNTTSFYDSKKPISIIVFLLLDIFKGYPPSGYNGPVKHMSQRVDKKSK